MKEKFFITKGLIFTVFSLILGIIFLYKGIEMQFNYMNSMNLVDLKSEVLQTGKIVIGNIESYVEKEIINLGTGGYSGVSQTYISGGREYDIYVIQLKNNKYIQLMIGEQQYKEKLKNMSGNNNIHFEGMIEEAPFTVNYEWCEGLDENIYPNIKNNIISEYIIKEINITDNNKKIYVGIILIIMAVILYFRMGGIKRTYFLEETDNYKRSNEYLSSYNNENELMYENEYLSKLMDDMKKLNNKIPMKLIIFFIGIIVFSSSYYVEMKLIGGVIVWLGLKGLWTCFINSSNIVAVKVARKYGVESTYLKVLQCKSNIKELEEFISDKTEK